MRIVLDTNIMLVIISKRAKNRWIFDKLLSGEITLCVTTDILDEYAEIVERYMGQTAAITLMELLDELPNVLHITRYFRWELITEDPDDNKFVDCAIAAEASFIVSEDRHFNILSEIPFPKVIVMGVEAFGEVFL